MPWEHGLLLALGTVIAAILANSKNLVHGPLGIFLRHGAAGLLALGIADSSFLILPFGNDLLLLTLIARNHSRAWEYVPIAAAGSVIGIFLLDLLTRKEGEAGLEKMMSRKRFDDWKKKINERAAYTVMLGCLAPPPFPFRAVIVAASAFQYPRHKLLGVAFVSRFVRFSIVAALAIVFGRQVLSVAESPAAFWAMIGFIVLCAMGTAYSVVRWIRQRRKTVTIGAQPKDPIPNT
jgi:membrane protein YqaA with SNARE-associated domain